MRGFSLLALVIAMGAAAYLYQQSLQHTTEQLGAESPKQIKPKLDQIGRDIERQNEMSLRRIEDATR